MKITIRRTSSFAELKVDEIETTIFNSYSKEIDDTIENLEEVIEELKKLKSEYNENSSRMDRRIN